MTWMTFECLVRPSAAITARVSGSASWALLMRARNAGSRIGSASRKVSPSLSIETVSVVGVPSPVAPRGSYTGMARETT